MEHIKEKCKRCQIRKQNDYRSCIKCLSRYLIPIYSAENYCPKCLNPYEGYSQCAACYIKIKNQEYFLDGLISCSYEYGENSDFGYAMHAYKGSKIPIDQNMLFPLASLLKVFLKNHLTCIRNEFGPLNTIAPIPGRKNKSHIETLLNLAKIPYKSLLRDTDSSVGQSSGGQKTVFDPDRYQVISTIPQNILLVDDVFTKGATANSAAFTLKKGGAKKVILLTLAKHESKKYLPDKLKPFEIDKCIYCYEYNDEWPI